jgi:hypothetical protein
MICTHDAESRGNVRLSSHVAYATTDSPQDFRLWAASHCAAIVEEGIFSAIEVEEDGP